MTDLHYQYKLATKNRIYVEHLVALQMHIKFELILTKYKAEYRVELSDTFLREDYLKAEYKVELSDHIRAIPNKIGLIWVYGFPGLTLEGDSYEEVSL